MRFQQYLKKLFGATAGRTGEAPNCSADFKNHRPGRPVILLNLCRRGTTMKTFLKVSLCLLAAMLLGGMRKPNNALLALGFSMLLFVACLHLLRRILDGATNRTRRPL